MVTSIKGNDTSTFGGNVDVPQIITDAPVFSAIKGSTQALSSATVTKLNYDTEQFDTNNLYDVSTSRFTPNVEGYYQINAQFSGASPSYEEFIIYIYKNGASLIGGAQFGGGNTTPNYSNKPNASALVYLNGSTDYLEIYGYVSQAQTLISSSFSFFQGHLVRAV